MKCLYLESFHIFLTFTANFLASWSTQQILHSVFIQEKRSFENNYLPCLRILTYQKRPLKNKVHELIFERNLFNEISASYI